MEYEFSIVNGGCLLISVVAAALMHFRNARAITPRIDGWYAIKTDYPMSIFGICAIVYGVYMLFVFESSAYDSRYYSDEITKVIHWTANTMYCSFIVFGLYFIYESLVPRILWDEARIVLRYPPIMTKTFFWEDLAHAGASRRGSHVRVWIEDRSGRRISVWSGLCGSDRFIAEVERRLGQIEGLSDGSG